MDIEAILEHKKKEENLLKEIPSLKKIISSLGSRIKEQGDLLFILEHAIKDIQAITTDVGQKKIKQETYNYVIYKLREEMKENENIEITTIKDFLKILPVKMYKDTGKNKQED
jgi:hypothetical protein